MCANLSKCLQIKKMNLKMFMNKKEKEIKKKLKETKGQK